MKAYQIGPQTGLDSLTLVERPDPVPGAGEVLLAPRLVGLNHRDLLVLSGHYGAPKPEDRIPVSEGVAEVKAVGAGVHHVKVGDRVIFAHFATWIDGAFSPSAFAHDIGITHDGWLAERLCVPAAPLIVVPEGISDEQAAPLASAALTAWNAVVEVGQVKAGDTVLTLGTGGVSIFALQIARMNGARVAITSSNDDKLELARKLGADILINYRTNPAWEAELLEKTGGHGADIIVENGGQASLPQSITAAAPNGRIIVIGALAGQATGGIPNYGAIIGKNLVIRGIAEGSKAMLKRLLDAVAINGIEPVIDRVFPFDEAKQAYEYLHQAGHVGKILIRF